MPGDFREYFDASEFSTARRGAWEFVLNSQAYEEYFKPYIESRLRQMNDLWKDRSRDRQEQYPDDYLAGGVVFGEAMLRLFDTIIKETNIERIHSAMAGMSNDDIYDAKRRSGQVKTIVGLDQSAEPLPPEEDY